MAKGNQRLSQPRRGRSFMMDSPWSRVSDEIRQGWGLRKSLIKKLQDHLQGLVILYFTAFSDEDIIISDQDAEMIENMLSVEHEKGSKIFLIINSAGGFPLAAERIVNICRAYSGGKFEVVVPHMAKSAATLICFGANCIHMSPTAELGPVDPQVQYIDDLDVKQWISAEEYIKSYEQLMNRAVSSKTGRVEALVQQLLRYDARYIERLRSAQALSVKISLRLLKTVMLSKFTESTIKKKISDFLVHRRTAAHGRMITIEEAKKCGLNIKEIELRSDLWNLLWELFIRADCAVSMPQPRKIIESANSSLSAGGKRRTP